MEAKKLLNSSGIFYDSADLRGLKRWFNAGIIGGVTTNPVIFQKDKVFDIPKHISKMIDIVGPGFPISIEVPDSETPKGKMIELALKYYARFPDNAVIKIPMDPRDSQKAFEVMHKLSRKGVRINATFGITAGQLIGACEALRGGDDCFVSLFWGRCQEATGFGGIGAVDTLTTLLKYRETHKLTTKVIVGSVRTVSQIETAFLLGADIVTIPPKLIDEWMFTQRGVDTADQFNKAYRDIKNKVKLI